MDKIIQSEFLSSCSLFLAFYKLNGTNFYLWNNEIKFHNNLQNNITQGFSVKATMEMMEGLRQNLKEIPGIYKMYYRMDTKNTGNYNIMYMKKNMGVT